jgi:hypothetical protein
VRVLSARVLRDCPPAAMSSIWEALRTKNVKALKAMLSKKTVDVNEVGAVRPSPARAPRARSARSRARALAAPA